jgi:hypothetical protein
MLIRIADQDNGIYCEMRRIWRISSKIAVNGEIPNFQWPNRVSKISFTLFWEINDNVATLKPVLSNKGLFSVCYRCLAGAH